ncbi:MAG: class I SAM-dependent methyltransferase [Acidobacteria bacterium]|nr:class I SAM-dependent methyltransferase [Acidobacteriota bacterium]
MALVIDSARNEVRALEQVTNWRGKQVLEIGCGNGRLSLRLARLGAYVQAVDPDARQIRDAQEALPKHLSRRVQYMVGNGEQLAFPSNRFDLVVFSWVL